MLCCLIGVSDVEFNSFVGAFHDAIDHRVSDVKVNNSVGTLDDAVNRSV